ncbi:probable pre-mRNA-splicing factor ATP-dependent RNA helicase DEAH9 [Tanacetum coccineum]
MIILPLYLGLTRADQDLIFSPSPRGKRKVVISINITETSLTLEITDIENLVVAPISKASTRQRAGRVGRVRPGKCYRSHIHNIIFLNEMSTHGIPEMQRSNLASSVIQLKSLGIDNILGFDWPSSPSPEAMVRALEVLYSLGVLDDHAKLTSLVGFQVAESTMYVILRYIGQRELDEAKMRFAAAEWNLSNEVGFPVTNKSFDALLESLLSTAKPFPQSVGYQILAS